MRVTLDGTRLNERVLDGIKILRRLIKLEGTETRTLPLGSKEIIFENPGMTFLYFYSRGVGKILTIRTNDAMVGNRILEITTPQVGASVETFVGQFDRGRYNDDKKNVSVTINSTEYTEIALFKV